jgi:hypothetical protein
LTRYCGNYVIDDLEQLRLSVARISSFNDPFELHLRAGNPLTRSGAKRHLRSRMRDKRFWEMAAQYFPGQNRKQLKRTIRSNRGRLISAHLEAKDSLVQLHRSQAWKSMERYVRLMCFTEPKDDDPAEIPMWGYYGAKHEGVRIHVGKRFCEQVGFSLIRAEYQAEPPSLDLSLDPVGDDFYEFTGRVIRSKSNAWSHENEWRLMIPAESCFEATDSKGMIRDFINIKPEHISRIDLGIRFNPELFMRVDALRNKFPNIEFYQTEKHPQAYYPVYFKRD